jgi:hypothetical protein
MLLKPFHIEDPDLDGFRPGTLILKTKKQRKTDEHETDPFHGYPHYD